MIKEELQLFDEVVCVKELTYGGISVKTIPVNTRGYYLPPHKWESNDPKHVWIYFERKDDATDHYLGIALLEEIQLVKRNTAEDLVNHLMLAVQEAARDKILQNLLKSGPLRARAKTISTSSSKISWYGNHLSEGEQFVILKRKKAESYIFLKENVPEVSQKCEYTLRQLALIDWTTLSTVTKEELLTSANQSLRELAIDKNALSYGKLIKKFTEQRSLTRSLFGDLFHFLEGGRKKGNGFGLTNFPAAQRKKLLEVLGEELSQDLIDRTAALMDDLDKTFCRLEKKFKGFIEDEKANAKEAFINQEEE